MRHAVALFIILFGVWLLNSGHYSTLLVGFGVGSSLLVLWLARRMRIVDSEAIPLHMLLRALGYIPWFTLQVFKSSVDVALRSLSLRKPRVSPRLFDAPAGQKSDLGRVLYANSITLTPGTLSIWVHGRAISVHAISDEAAEFVLEGKMDEKVTWMEGLTE